VQAVTSGRARGDADNRTDNETDNEADEAQSARFRPPSRRTFVAMLGAAAAALALRDRLTGREVLRNPVTGKPIWIGHV
jgi:hypothetical protein